MSRKHVAISLGGSVVHPQDGLDTDFLSAFRDCIRTYTQDGYRFVITVGGGALSRRLQEVAQNLASPNTDALDMLGITGVSVHSTLLHTIFEGVAYPEICLADAVENAYLQQSPVVIVGAKETGKSTDHNAVGYIYDADPDMLSDAQPIDTLSLDDYIEMIPDSFSPGLHLPVGPPAARLAKESDIEIAVVAGEIQRIQNVLSARSFDGTLLN
ncbi:MAG: hypothetical protein BRC24_00285 [Parcubacteria group bacterium SW_4_46_8]|nr:MAG: hypothetical protein BRC24_00285 [Parcubacteria group bacterium SW_4_46_8]